MSDENEVNQFEILGGDRWTVQQCIAAECRAFGASLACRLCNVPHTVGCMRVMKRDQRASELMPMPVGNDIYRNLTKPQDTRAILLYMLSYWQTHTQMT